MIIARTPLRVSLMGGTSDYPAWVELNGGGTVLSATIDKYVYTTCRYLPPFFEHRGRIVWSEIELVKSVPEIHNPIARECLRFCGAREGVEIHYDADLPARSGLGSSSAFTVGLLHALYGLQGKMPSSRRLALDAIYVERERAGAIVGSQDQVAAAYGGLNRIDFYPGGDFAVRPMALAPETLAALESRLMLFYTGAARNASEVAKEQIVDAERNKAQVHALREMAVAAASNLASGNLSAIGEMLHESWKLKRGLGPNIGTSAADLIYGKALAAGATGGKLTGAGGGGFFLLFIPPERRDDIRAALTGFLEVPFKFESDGSRVIYYAPDGERGDGVMVHQGEPWVTACGSGMN